VEALAAVADLVASQTHLGVQVAAYHDGELVIDLAAGHLDPERARPVRPDSLFCCFSVTKGVAAVVAWRLVAKGVLDPDAPVSRYWPGFRTEMTVAQALSHQGGLHAVPRPLSEAFVCDDRAGLDWVANALPAWPPGTATGYHTLTYGWLIRGIVEGATGEPFPAVVADDLYIGLPESEEGRAATVVERPEARGLHWLTDTNGSGPHPAIEAFPPEFPLDWNAPEIRRARQPAFAGWASARALARLYAAPGADPAAMGRCLVAGEDRCLEIAIRRGMGFELGGRYEGGSVGALGPRETAFGHGGHGGSVAFADPEVGLAIAVTVNLLLEPGAAAERTTTICELIRGLLGAA
jgi:CubicO group peptidase (beta-lactamase class C family)